LDRRSTGYAPTRHAYKRGSPARRAPIPPMTTRHLAGDGPAPQHMQGRPPLLTVVMSLHNESLYRQTRVAVFHFFVQLSCAISRARGNLQGAGRALCRHLAQGRRPASTVSFNPNASPQRLLAAPQAASGCSRSKRAMHLCEDLRIRHGQAAYGQNAPDRAFPWRSLVSNFIQTPSGQREHPFTLTAN
jgi:hypothetical protein